MFILIKIFLLAVMLYLFVNYFLCDFMDRKNSINYKIYLFLFMFIINFMFQFFSNLINHNKILVNDLIVSSVSISLITVIAFDIYYDLSYDGFFETFNNQQHIMMLILLIIGFISTITILEILILSN